MTTPDRPGPSPAASGPDAPAASAAPVERPGTASRLSVLAVVCVVLLAGVFCLRRMHDYDVLWHVRTGDWILAEGRVPQVDPFGQDPGRPWIAVSWAADVLMALGARAGGLAGLQLAVAAVVMVSFAAVLRRSGRSPLLLWCGLLAVLTAWSRFLVRPDVLSLPLVLVLVALEDRLPRAGVRGVLAVAAVAVIWCNVHGSFVLAPALLAAALAGRWLAGRAVGSHLAALAAASLAPLVTPYSAGLYTLLAPYVESLLAAVGVGEMRALTLVEWRPGWQLLLSSPAFPRLALPLLLAVTLLSLARAGRPREQAGRYLQLAVMTVLVLTAVRHLLPFAAACLALTRLAGRDRRPAPGPQAVSRAHVVRLQAAAVTAIALTLLALVVTDRFYVARDVPLRTGLGLDDTLVPDGAARWLAEKRAPGRVFNNFDSGAYLHYRLYPRFHPYLDARLVDADLYFRVRDAVSAPPVFDEMAQREGIETVVLSHPSSETFTLLPHLTRDDGWQLVARDRVSTVHVRRSSLPVRRRRPPWSLSPAGEPDGAAARVNALLASLKTDVLPAADLADALVSRLVGDARREAAAFRRARRKAPDHPRVRAFFEARRRLRDRGPG